MADARAVVAAAPPELLESVRKEIRGFGDVAEDVITEQCDDATIQRYLRARNGNVHKAAKLLHGTLLWRKEFKTGECRDCTPYAGSPA